MELPSTNDMIDVPGILGFPVSVVNQKYGNSLNTKYLEPAEIEYLPGGGLCKTYHKDAYTFWVFYESGGKSIGFQIIDGLAQKQYRMDDWPVILSSLNLQTSERADFDGQSIKRWNNVNGFKITLSRDPLSDEYVWSVQVWKLA